MKRIFFGSFYVFTKERIFVFFSDGKAEEKEGKRGAPIRFVIVSDDGQAP